MMKPFSGQVVFPTMPGRAWILPRGATVGQAGESSITDRLRAEYQLLRNNYFLRSSAFFAFGAAMWVAVCMWFGLWRACTVPLAYLTFTAVNLLWGWRSGNFSRGARTQVILSILLPYVFQMLLGGLTNSGIVMMWSFLATASVLTFKEPRSALTWMLVNIILAVIFVYFDPAMHDPALARFEVPTKLFLSINLVAVGFAIMFLARVFVRKQTSIHKRLNEANSALEATYVEVQRYTTDLQQGMSYARNIQASILPDLNDLSRYIKEHFVYFMPKEEVGGDHFWAAEVDDVFYLAVVDCTGHGTPGALLTMMSTDVINQVIVSKRIDDPGRIVQQVHKRMRRRLTRAGEATSDGVELAVLRIDPAQRKVSYAGTGINLIMRRGDDLSMVRADRGLFMYQDDKEVPVATEHDFDHEQGAQFYFCSDGVPHQINDAIGKKFKMSGWMEVIDRTGHLPMEEQGQALSMTMSNWKGSGDQLDDMLAVGVKLT